MNEPRAAENGLQAENRQLRDRVTALETELRATREEHRLSAVAFGEIKERKSAEQALRASEQQLTSIYNTVRDVIFCLAIEPEEQYRFVSVNAAFHRVTGLLRDDVIGKLVSEVIPQPSLAIVLQRYREAVEKKSIVSWDETSDYPAGRLTGAVTVAPVFDQNGSCTHLVGSVHDITERKHAEAAMRESEERFRLVADTAPVMIWVAGLDKLCTFFNKPWLDFRGRTMEEESGNGWLAGVHTDDQDRCFEIYTSSFDARRSFQMEYRLLRADGEYRWVLDTGTPHYRESEFAGYIGSCVDITEQKRVVEQLHNKQAQLVDSQRLAKVGSWEVDMATRKTRWSDEWYRIFGIPKEAPANAQTFLNTVHPRDREVVLQAENNALSSDAPFGVNFRIIHPGGEVRFIRAMVEATKNDDGSLARMAGAAQDITEEVKAIELLRESEARLRGAERMTHVGHWSWELATNRLQWSEEIFSIVGRPWDYQPSYQGLLEVLAPGDRERWVHWANDCLRRKQGSFIEHRIIRPSGEVRIVICTSEVVLGEDGSPQLMFGACQDVTDARRAQEESFARQKLESLGTLASGIAHDFNNLLGAVLAQAESAMAEIEAEFYPRAELKQIQEIAIRGGEIVRQMMIYAGNETEVPESVDLNKAVEGMLTLLKVTASGRATLSTDLSENPPVVRARAAQIRQIVMNLVVNAADATKGDGVIRVTTQCVPVTRDSVRAATEDLAEGDYVLLEVSDNGSGMLPETQARIFDPFFTTKSAGRGLGLAVIQGIVRSLRGTIRVDSEFGKGTTFQIMLPSAGTPGDSASNAVDGIEPGMEAPLAATVLLVEDEASLRTPVKKFLGKAGFTVLEAADGSEAIDILHDKSAKIDLLLLDMTIPGYSSHEVLNEAVRAWPEVRVILTSAYGEHVAKAKLNAPQLRGFIRKPFQLGTLVSTLRSALSS
jgi:two-component system, cell cycle sensor histidine kinase and response regulator CckA